MKIQIEAKLLEDLVGTVAQAIGSRPVRQENECVFIEVHSDSGTPIMTAFASDNGTAIRKVTDRITAIEDGCALIPAKQMMAFVKLMDGDVTMMVDDHFKCTLKCGAKKVSISCMDSCDYNADFVDMREPNTVRMDGDDFGKAVDSTLHCVSTDQGRMILTGVNFAFDAVRGICEASGLDGFRLAKVAVPAETNENFNVTIPEAGAKLIAKLIKGGENVSFRFGNGMVIADNYETSVEVTLLSGEYMDINGLIARQGNGKMHAKVNAEELLDATKLAMIATEDAQKGLIVLNFAGEDAMQVYARSDNSDAASEVYCMRNGQMETGTEIAFNGKYILEALKAVLDFSEEIEITANTPSAPLVILPVNRDDFYQLALPVRRM